MLAGAGLVYRFHSNLRQGIVLTSSIMILPALNVTVHFIISRVYIMAITVTTLLEYSKQHNNNYVDDTSIMTYLLVVNSMMKETII